MSLNDAFEDLLADEPPMSLSVPEVVQRGQRRQRARRRQLVGSIAVALAVVLSAGVAFLSRPSGKATGTLPTPSSVSTPPAPSPTAGSASPGASSHATPSAKGGDTVGAGGSAMVFPEKPGLTVARSGLTPYAGPAVVTGTYSQSNCVVTAPIRVEATGRLSLTNCWIRVNVGDDGTGMIGKAGRIELNHVLIDGTAFAGATLPVKLAGGGRVTFSEFTGTTENVRIESPADVEWNYVHNPKRRTAGGAAHSYGLTVTTGGGPVTVAHNWIDMSGAEGLGTDLNIVSDFGTVDGVRVEDNTFMPGGSYTLYVRTDGYCRCGTVRNVRVVNNRWYGDAAHVWGGQYGAFSVNDEASIAAWSGNTLTKAGAARPVPLPLANTQP